MSIGEPRRRRLLVTADDFGMSEDVNRAIAAAFERGLISNTSIMANMPGFDAACALVDRHGLHGRVGVHLNLSEGSPLTHPIRAHGRFCGPSGAFVRRRRVLRLSRMERQAVEGELEAQIGACLARGIRPSHFDSHHHIHTEWPIGTIVMRLADRHDVIRIRLTRSCGENLGALRRLYRLAYNGRLRVASLTDVRHFGAASHVLSVAATVAGTCEINVHPGLDASGALVDRMTGEALEALVRRLRAVGAIDMPVADVRAAAMGSRA